MEGARQWHADLSTMQNVALSMSGYEDWEFSDGILKWSVEYF